MLLQCVRQGDLCSCVMLVVPLDAVCLFDHCTTLLQVIAAVCLLVLNVQLCDPKVQPFAARGPCVYVQV